jgi:hypothetical protein
MSESKKFPWVEYISSFVFYLVIAVLIYIIASILPQPARQELTTEQMQTIQQQQQIAQTQEIYNQVLTAVGKLMVLPQTLPQISVVNDIQTFIKENPAFGGAQQGDIVLVYPDRVIVYSPATNRIVNTVAIPEEVQKRNAELQRQAANQQAAQAPAQTEEVAPAPAALAE